MSEITPQTFIKIADRLAQQIQLLKDAITEMHSASTAATAVLGAAGQQFRYVAAKKGWQGNLISIAYEASPDPNSPLSFEHLRLLSANQVQTVTLLTDFVATDTFTVSWEDQSVTGLTLDITATELLTTLNSNLTGLTISSITGGPFDTAPFVITFDGQSQVDDLLLTSTTQMFNSSNNLSGLDITEQQITFLLATDGGGSPITTAQELLEYITIQQLPKFQDIFYLQPVSYTPATVVSPLAKTFLSGAISGLFQEIITGADNPSLEEYVLEAAIDADEFITVTQMLRHPSYHFLMTALRSHLNEWDEINLIRSFLDTNDLRVHQNFSELHDVTFGDPLYGYQVFKHLPQRIAILTEADSEDNAYAIVKESGSYATVLIDPTGINNAIQFTAVTAGPAGESISVEYVNPGANSQPLTLTVSGNRVIYSLATSGAGAIISTAQDIINISNAHATLNTLISWTLIDAFGTGLVTAVSRTYLENSNNQIRVTAVAEGAVGNLYTITLVDPAGPTEALDVSIAGYDITVSLETDGSSNIISTAQDVIDEINSVLTGIVLATAESADVTGLVGPLATVNFSGGSELVITSDNPIGTGNSTDAGAGEYAAAPATLIVRPQRNTATAIIAPSNARAFYLFDPAGSDNQILFEANTPGTSAVTIQIIYLPAISQSLTVNVTGSAITVTLATDSGGAPTSTAQQVIDAVNGHGAASALVTAEAGEALATGVVQSGISAQALSHTKNQILYTAASETEAGNLVNITYVDPAGPSAAFSLVTVGNAITVNLATNSSSRVITTAAEIITAINADIDASALVTASPYSTSVAGRVAAVSTTYLWGGSGDTTFRDTQLQLVFLDSSQSNYTLVVDVPAGTVDYAEFPLTTQADYLNLNTGNSPFKLIQTYSAGTLSLVITKSALPLQALSFSVVTTGNDKVVTVSLATGYSGEITTTVYEFVEAWNASGTVNTLATAERLDNSGTATVSEITQTIFSGGVTDLRIYGVISASILSGGDTGDIYWIDTSRERELSL